VVTLFLKNIPPSVRQLELLDEVKTRGFEGKLDFLYLPWSKKEGKNEGYCILSFVDGRDAQDFFLEFYGNFLTSAPASSKSLSVCEVPNIQGLKALHGEFGHLSNQDPEYDPLFLRQVAAKPRTHLPQADFEAHGESACIHCRTRLHRGQTHCPRCGASVKARPPRARTGWR
ncbi:Protein MEI2-like 5, partial [Durusdinium trenchii]